MIFRRSFVLFAMLAVASVPMAVRAQSSPAAPQTFRNPVIPGFNPDPSICRAGDDYYVLTSSFEHFPAFPIHHSKDLVHWEIVGNVLTRPTQIDLESVGPSDGLFSPVMRQHGDTFYVTYTMLKYEPQQHVTNWLVTARAPAGPYSDPILITDDPMWRIDTSLFFDDDGRCYFTANSKFTSKRSGRRILMQEFDLSTSKLKGPVTEIGHGAFPDSTAAEAAHLFKRNGYYYLLLAEGGTGWAHAVSISRSRKVEGPYDQCPANLLLTHKDMSKAEVAEGKLYGVGHSDLVETPKGEWWMVLLVQRGAGVLGRETALVPVEWNQDDWPVISPGVGRVQLVERLPKKLPSSPIADEKREREEWKNGKLGPEWLFVRVPTEEFWSFTARTGFLRMSMKPATAATPDKTGCPPLITKRVTSHDYTVGTKLEFAPVNLTEEAGLILRRGFNSLSLVKGLTNGEAVVRLVAESKAERKVLFETKTTSGEGSTQLRIVCHAETKLSFFTSADGATWEPFGKEVNGSMLSNKAPGGVYTGLTAGIYATSNGQPTTNHADFAFFEYRDEPAPAP